MQRANYLAVTEHNPLPITAAQRRGEGAAVRGRACCRNWIFIARLLLERSIHSPGLAVWAEGE